MANHPTLHMHSCIYNVSMFQAVTPPSSHNLNQDFQNQTSPVANHKTPPKQTHRITNTISLR